MSKARVNSNLFEEKGAFLFKHLPMPSYAWQIVENDLILIDYNDAAYEITEGNIENYLEIKATELYNDQPEILEDLKRCVREKSNFFKEMNYKFKSVDNEKYLSFNYVFIPPDVVIIHTNDMTEKKLAELKLRESENNDRLLFGDSPNMILRLNSNGTIIDVNKAFLIKSEFKKEELIDKNFQDIEGFGSLHMQLFKAKFEEILNMGYIKPFELQISFKGNQLKWMSLQASLIEIEGKKLVQVIARDINERKESEQKLKESEQKYRLITENVNDLIIILNKDYKYEYINEAQHQKQRGTSNKDLIGTTPLELVHPDDIEKNKKGFRETFEVGEGLLETRIRNLGGGYNWFEIKGKAFKDIDGKTKVLLISRDITERKEVERRLRESEEKYRLIAENANDMIYILNQDYELEYINENVFMKQIGYTSEDLIGKSPLEYIHPEDIKRVSKGLIKGFKVGQGTIELRIRDKKSNYHWLEVRGQTFLDTDGTSKVLSIARDITERKQAEQKLNKSLENRKELENIINRSPAVVFLWKNKEGWPVEYVSENIEHFGYTPEEFYSGELPYIEIVHPDDLERIAAEVNFHSMEGAQEFEQEYRIITKSGAVCYIDDHSWIRRNQKGEITHYQGIILDITERMSFELELKESEEKFRTLAEQSFIGITLLQDNRIKYVNKTLAAMFGYSIDEVTNWQARQFLDVIHPEDKEFVAEQATKKQSGEVDAINQYQFRGIKKNGDVIWLEVFSKFINYEGKPADFATLIDITEKKLAEEKLKDSAIKFQNLYEEAPNAYFSIAPDKSIIRCNKAAENLFGYSRKELFEMKVFDLYANTEDGLEKAKQIFKQYLAGKQIQDQELQMKNKSGEIVWISLSVKPIFDDEGNVIESRSMLIDISARKRVEMALRESEEKYREAYSRANFYKDLFAHDINNIMQVINSSAELISYQLDETEKSKNIEMIATMIKKQIARAKKLVQNVIILSDLEESHQPIKLTEVCELLRNSINFMNNSFPEREINLQIESFNKRIFAQANELLQDVFENILTNAVRYNDKITVELEIKISKAYKEGKNYIKIEFRDNGIGVADDRKAIIFEKGHRILKGLKGMGLGLSLVKKILTIYDGKIWVEDRVRGDYNQGSNFILLMPQ